MTQNGKKRSRFIQIFAVPGNLDTEKRSTGTGFFALDEDGVVWELWNAGGPGEQKWISLDTERIED